MNDNIAGFTVTDKDFRKLHHTDITNQESQTKEQDHTNSMTNSLAKHPAANKDKVYSAEDKVYSAEDKAYSAEDKVYSAEDKVYSAEDKAYSAEDKLYSAEESMRKRSQQIHKKCQKRRQDWKGDHLYIATANTNAFALYPIAKCGWTSWIHVIFSNVGRAYYLNHRLFKWGWSSPYHHAGMRLKTSENVKTYKERIVFVRNPYERLVSAYQDKILNNSYSFLFHKPCEWLEVGMPHLTFPQFVKCIVDKARLLSSDDLSSSKAAEDMDIHWTPQYWSALPCSSNYTLIGHLKHMEDDLTAAIKILQLNATYVHMNQGKQTPNNLAYYYNQIPAGDKEALHQIYKLDFEIFGFNDTIPS